MLKISIIANTNTNFTRRRHSSPEAMQDYGTFRNHERKVNRTDEFRGYKPIYFWREATIIVRVHVAPSEMCLYIYGVLILEIERTGSDERSKVRWYHRSDAEDRQGTGSCFQAKRANGSRE